MSAGSWSERDGLLVRVAEHDELRDRLDELCRHLPGEAGLQRAVGEFGAPLRIAVYGRPGTGRDTLARALRDRLGAAPIGPGDSTADADAWIYLLTEFPRAADRQTVAALAVDRGIVVLGKADTLGTWQDADDRAAQCAQELQRNVIAVMPLLATANVAADELDVLSGLAAAGELMPAMAAQFLVTEAILAGDNEEKRIRTGMLRRIDRYGLSLCLAELARDPGISAAQLNGVLHAHSRIDRLAGPLTELIAVAAPRRLSVLLDELNRLAATGSARDELEHLLTGSIVARLERTR